MAPLLAWREERVKTADERGLDRGETIWSRIARGNLFVAQRWPLSFVLRAHLLWPAGVAVVALGVANECFRLRPLHAPDSGKPSRLIALTMVALAIWSIDQVARRAPWRQTPGRGALSTVAMWCATLPLLAAPLASVLANRLAARQLIDRARQLDAWVAPDCEASLLEWADLREPDLGWQPGPVCIFISDDPGEVSRRGRGLAAYTAPGEVNASVVKFFAEINAGELKQFNSVKPSTGAYLDLLDWPVRTGIAGAFHNIAFLARARRSVWSVPREDRTDVGAMALAIGALFAFLATLPALRTVGPGGRLAVFLGLAAVTYVAGAVSTEGSHDSQRDVILTFLWCLPPAASLTLPVLLGFRAVQRPLGLALSALVLARLFAPLVPLFLSYASATLRVDSFLSLVALSTGISIVVTEISSPLLVRLLAAAGLDSEA
jgi:hypothetical protein